MINLKTLTIALLSVLLFIFQYLNSNAQPLTATIKGKVMDEKSGPLPFATVVLKVATDSSLYKSVLTNDEGIFQLSGVKPGTFILEVRMIGYQNAVRTTVVKSIDLDMGNIRLDVSAKMLSTVMVAANKPLIERRPDKIVVNLSEGITAGASVMEVMDRLPGVTVSPDDQISLNGRSIRIYIDGKATPLSAEALSGLLKGMSSSNIQKIELIAHPSSKYDAAGSGGIINIVRKRNSKDGVSGNTYGGLGQGEYNKHSAGLNLNYKTDKYNLFINNDYQFNKYFVNNDLTSIFLSPEVSSISQSHSLINSTRTNRNYTPSIGLDLYLSDKTTLSVSALEGLQWFNKDASSVTQNFGSNQAHTSTDRFLNFVHTNSHNFSTNMHLSHKVDTTGREYTVDADYYRYNNITNQDNINFLYTNNGILANTEPSLFLQDRSFNVYALKSDYTLPLHAKAQLEMGVKSSYVTSDNSNRWYELSQQQPVLDKSLTDVFHYRENINAGYINFSNEYKKFSYQLGIRAEQTLGKGEQSQTGETFHKSYFQLFPSAYLTYKLNSQHELIFSADRKVDRPTYENLNPLIRIINSTTFLQGNPFLRPSTSYNLSATYGYHSALYTTFEYSINEHDFTYFTSPYNTAGVTTTKPENNKYTQYYNFLIAFNKQVNAWWYTSSNASLNRRSYKGNIAGDDLSSSGLVGLNLDNYNSFSLSKKFSLITLFRYRGKSQERNVTNDPYFTLTTGVRQSLWNNKASVALNVTDIFHSYKSSYLQTSALVNQYWNNHYETTAVRLNFTYNFGGKVKKTKVGNGAAEEKRRTDIKEN